MVQSSLMNVGMIGAAGTNVKRVLRVPRPSRPCVLPAVVIGCTKLLHFAPIFLPAHPLLFLEYSPPPTEECLMSERIHLDVGNVLLKPSHRRQLMTWLKRAMRLGARLGDLVVRLSVQRTGRLYEVRATVHDSAGDFDCRRRDRDWRDAMRDVVMTLTAKLHSQRVAM
jgi:hypothetical protein